MSNCDKQIIIDGVDVSWCENLMQGIVPFGCMEDRKTCSCMNNPNCLYKQLKRKEQECEELKSDNLQEVGQLKFAIGTLTAENLHLKELLDMRIEALCDSCKAGSMLPIKCRIYEKTLTEIKEIADKKCLGCVNFCNDDNTRFCVIKQILQKINEVEHV